MKTLRKELLQLLKQQEGQQTTEATERFMSALDKYGLSAAFGNGMSLEELTELIEKECAAQG